MFTEHKWVASRNTNAIIKYEVDTTVVDLIHNNSERVYTVLGGAAGAICSSTSTKRKSFGINKQSVNGELFA